MRRLPTGLAIAAATILAIRLLSVVTPATADDEAAADAPTVSFAVQIQPIFEARCVECHSGPDAEWGLDLTSYEGAMKGSDYGPVVEPGAPAESLMIKLLVSEDMPGEGEPVPPEELELLEIWIAEGAAPN